MSPIKSTTRQRVCKHLRSKEMYHSESPLEEDAFHSGLYWCDQTSDGIGPDGACAESGECASSRGCFED